ncbi:threonine synthase [Rhizosaccharibacter radicis]|uniref:Threonine synthase n=1 Tax=Rhizosaccharibacter radicis TaxID=2782605 RepID=A0ABT1VX43_9PROT|nr:threonine synthase [Acetobacteraceae bacterium KSS12]
MQYVSTRGDAAPRDFAGVLLSGLAEDGGLFVPEAWPTFTAAEWRSFRGLSYPDLAARLIAPFAAGSIAPDVIRRLCAEAYAGFGHPATVPLVQLEGGLWVQELFHGPTLAFKDLAMQLLGRLFDHVLRDQDRRITIVGATSGDTGSAAIEACRDRERIRAVILHPRGRTSEVQRRQMTTVLSPNIANLAVEGTFDDCQDLVKAMFADAPFREELSLSAVNSINWARVAAQIPYYAAAAIALGAPDREVSFAVPTGNFGNVLAAWAARQMGLPVARLMVGSNRNDILTRFLRGNDMSVRPVEPSLSPSMDIGVSSNFERLLFELLGRDAGACAQVMRNFRDTGRMDVPDAAWREAASLFEGFRLDDPGTEAEIRRVHAATGYLADPHTAIGIAAGRAGALPGVPTVAMATAHPAKFPDAIEAATGLRPPLPPRLDDLYEREERFRTVANRLSEVQGAVRNAVFSNAA